MKPSFTVASAAAVVAGAVLTQAAPLPVTHVQGRGFAGHGGTSTMAGQLDRRSTIGGLDAMRSAIGGVDDMALGVGKLADDADFTVVKYSDLLGKEQRIVQKLPTHQLHFMEDSAKKQAKIIEIQHRIDTKKEVLTKVGSDAEAKKLSEEIKYDGFELQRAQEDLSLIVHNYRNKQLRLGEIGADKKYLRMQ